MVFDVGGKNNNQTNTERKEPSVSHVAINIGGNTVELILFLVEMVSQDPELPVNPDRVYG